jgi:hypothetical protein
MRTLQSLSRDFRGVYLVVIDGHRAFLAAHAHKHPLRVLRSGTACALCNM